MDKIIIDQYLAAKKPLTLLKGKIPIVNDWPNVIIPREYLYSHKDNLGWILDVEDLVVDVDPRNGGTESFTKLQKDLNIKLTPTVTTPSGGVHCYTSIPVEYQDRKLRKTLKKYPGIDFLSKKSQCVIPSSKTEVGEYKWTDELGCFEQTEAPEALISLLSPSYREDNEPTLASAPQVDGWPEEKVWEMLSQLDPSMPHDDWIKVGMSLHDWNKVKGLIIWEDWSKGGNNYTPDETLKRWGSFTSGGGVTIGTLVYMVNQANQLTIENQRIFVAKDHSGIAKKFLQDNYNIAGVSALQYYGGDWYLYEEIRYIQMQEKLIKKKLRKYLDTSHKYVENNKIERFYPNKSIISSLLDAIESETYLESSAPPVWLKGHENEDPKDFVSFKNCILRISTRELLPHSAHFFTTTVLPYDYVEAGEAARWKKFLHEIFAGDQESIDTLQEIFGYLITAITHLQKMFMLIGPKRSGKGTINRILGEMLGKSNICSPSLSSLSSNFGLQPLHNKLLATFPDVRLGGKSDIKTMIGNLLSISGEDDVTIDRKYKDAWHGRVTARVLIMSNDIPQMSDASDALVNRFIYLQTKSSFFGQEDTSLTENLLQELPEIFLWALDGRKRLLDRGKFIQPESSKHLLEDNKRLSNPLYEFIDEMCELGESYSVTKNYLYMMYDNWCRDNGYKFPKSNAVFARDLQTAFNSITPGRKSTDNGRIPIFHGIRVVEPASDGFGV